MGSESYRSRASTFRVRRRPCCQLPKSFPEPGNVVTFMRRVSLIAPCHGRSGCGRSQTEAIETFYLHAAFGDVLITTSFSRILLRHRKSRGSDPGWSQALLREG